MIAGGIGGLVLAIFLAGWFAMWDWRRLERQIDRLAERRRWGADNQYARVSTAEMQTAYEDALRCTLIRNDLVSHDYLVQALERRPPVLEVIG